MFVFKFHLTTEEYLDYNYYTAWSSPAKKAYRFKYYLRVMVMYIAIAGLYIFAKRSHDPLVDYSVFLGIGLVYFLLVPVLVKRSIRMKVRQILADPENQHVLSESVVSMDENGIQDKDTASDNWYQWDQIIKKAETTRCIYLYTNSYHAVVIPRRVISPGDRVGLELLFTRHLPLHATL